MIRLRRGKWRPIGTVPSGASATHGADLQQLLEERAVLLGIDDVDPTAHDRDGAGGKRAGVGAGVDAAGHARDQGEARRAQVCRQPLGEVEPVRGRVARAHHGDAVTREQVRTPAQGDDRRRVVDGGERWRIGRLAQRDRVPADLFECLEFALGCPHASTP